VDEPGLTMSAPRLPQSLPHAPDTETGAWPSLDDDFLSTLPAVLRAVVRALGFTRAGDWLQEYGGVNCNVPAFRERAMGLAPEELARLRITLRPHLDANGRLWLPKADKLYQRIRNTQIRKDRGAASLSTLAHRYRLSSRQIQNICSDEEDAQLDLF